MISQACTGEVKIPRAQRVSFRFIFRMLRGGVTLIRELADRDIILLSKYLCEAEEILEFGGASSYYKTKVSSNSQRFTVTGMAPNCDRIIDMTQMDLPDNSVDGAFSAFALEHVEEYKRFVAEAHRVLKPGGRMLLSVPFMYCFHGAPSDYVRFTKPYLEYLFREWRMLAICNVGNRAALVCEIFNEKPWMNLPSTRVSRFFNRTISLLACIAYILNPSRSSTFPSAFVLVVEKKA